MRGNLTVIFAITLLMVSRSLAQPTDSLAKDPLSKPDPPIQFEVAPGGAGFNLQTILSKQFARGSRFGLLTITALYGNYRNDKERNEFVSQSFLTTRLWRGISVNAGLSANNFSGFRPTAGLQYVFATKSLVVLLLPRVDLAGTRNVETFGFVEYKPRFTKQWGLYSRVQGLTNYSTQPSRHERSHIYLRLGASYQHFQAGVGTNIDVYGPEKIRGTTLVGFLRTEIF